MHGTFPVSRDITAIVLAAARDLIADPENWTNDPQELGARHCMASACGHEAMRVGYPDSFQLACHRLAKAIGTLNLPHWNDTHTHAEVLAAFDRAIEAA